jgi:heme/copper-type cytochrome/quinol oxidase subunit 2
MRRAEFLQWFGLLGAALAWTAQLVLGFGVADARCAAAGIRWGLDLDTWQIVLMAVAGVLVLLAEAAAVWLFRATKDTGPSGPPPWGRRHFFVAGASLGNILFLVMIVLSGVAVIADVPCRQA